jgi:hypothetical protein
VSALSIALATIIGLTVNLVWFSPRGFFPAWWRALGHTEPVPTSTEGSASMAPTFAMTLAALLVQSLVLLLAIRIAAGATSSGEVTVGLGALVGLVAGVGIAASSSLGHRLFSGQGLRVWAIEVGGDIASLTAMGAVLGLAISRIG